MTIVFFRNRDTAAGCNPGVGAAAVLAPLAFEAASDEWRQAWLLLVALKML
jgi:hypothetical protein